MQARGTRPLHLLLPLSLAAAIAGCSGGGGSSGDGTSASTASAALGTADAPSLEAYLKTALALETPTEVVQSGSYPPGVFRVDTAVLFSTTATTTAAPAAETSTTNLQVAGVDEADRVKAGGGHLYVSLLQQTYLGWDPTFTLMPITTTPGVISTPGTGGAVLIGATRPIVFDPGPLPEPPPPEPARIRVLALDEPNAQAEEVATIELSEVGTNIEGLYFVEGTDADPGDLLVVIAAGSPYGHSSPDFRTPGHWENGRTSVHWIDVSEPSAPREIAKTSFMGRSVSSRRIGDQLYVVSRHRPSLPIDPWPTTQAAADANTRMLANATLDDLLPVVQVEDGDGEWLVRPRDCTILKQAGHIQPSPALTTITQIDLRDRPAQRSACLAGTIDTVFATPTSLYLTSIDYANAASDIALHKFALEADGPEFRGTGYAPGRLWSQGTGGSFHLGERDGVVGIVTTLYAGHPSFSSTGTYEHRLTLLREADGVAPALEEVAHLPNEREPAAIGKPNEFLHGVRFMDARVYVVTFRKVDPLYILDISDPANPHIAGQVEIPGFSDYLHPVGDDLLIGVGKDTAEGVNNNWFQGVKVELFDVSDPTTLESIDAEVLGRRGSDTNALRDHHAFTFLAGEDGDVDRFAIPVTLHDTLPDGGDPESPTQYYEWTHTGLHLFQLVHGDSPRIDAVGAVVAEERDPDGENRWGSVGSFDRAVIQGTAVHYVHDQEVWSAPWDDPGDVIGPQ